MNTRNKAKIEARRELAPKTEQRWCKSESLSFDLHPDAVAHTEGMAAAGVLRTRVRLRADGKFEAIGYKPIGAE